MYFNYAKVGNFHEYFVFLHRFLLDKINLIYKMELASKYDPSEVESKWYQYWLDNKLFSSKPDGREPYTIVIPPPNVTGVLHMGHMLNNTIQDILVRRARMEGKNACWVPGTDHASIATEAKVVNKLAQQGIKKTDLTRDEFLKHAWDWTNEHGGIILKQLRKLGASCDWEQLKLQEKDGNKRVLSGVPDALPSLIKAYRIQDKARNVGFDWEDKGDVWKKVREELGELENELKKEDKENSTKELGDFLFSVINAARLYHLNPDTALEHTNQKFIKRFNYIEDHSIKAGKPLTEMTLDEMDELWNEAKSLEKR